MKNKSDIIVDHSTNEVVVLDKHGNEVFRKPKSEQVISIAHGIYMYHKYKEEWNENKAKCASEMI